MLEIEGLKVSRGRFTACLPQLVLQDGECVALCGVSGSGKSTLLEAIGLLSPWEQVNRFVLNRIAVNELAEDDARALRVCDIGIMPQSGGLLPYLTIRDNLQIQIALALKQQVSPVFPKGIDPATAVSDPSVLPTKRISLANENSRARVHAYVEDLMPISSILQLDNLLDKLPHQLSIGQRQRALFLRAIAHKPKLILIDEPTASLDPENARNIFALIDKIAVEANLSIILVTHDLKAAQRYRCYSYDPEQSHQNYSLFVAQADLNKTVQAMQPRPAMPPQPAMAQPAAQPAAQMTAAAQAAAPLNQ